MEKINPVEFFDNDNENKQTLASMNMVQQQGAVNLLSPSLMPSIISQPVLEQVYVENVRGFNRVQIELVKNEIAKAREERKEERDYQRRYATECLKEDEFGYLRIHLQYPNGIIKVSRPVVNVPYLKLTIFSSREFGREVYILNSPSWTKGIVLRDLIMTDLIRVLDRQGVMILAGRDRKRHVAKLILDFLISHSELNYIPYGTFGWYKNSRGNWEFLDEKEHRKYSELGVQKYE